MGHNIPFSYSDVHQLPRFQISSVEGSAVVTSGDKPDNDVPDETEEQPEPVTADREPPTQSKPDLSQFTEIKTVNLTKVYKYTVHW